MSHLRYGHRRWPVRYAVILQTRRTAKIGFARSRPDHPGNVHKIHPEGTRLWGVCPVDVHRFPACLWSAPGTRRRPIFHASQFRRVSVKNRIRHFLPDTPPDDPPVGCRSNGGPISPFDGNRRSLVQFIRMRDGPTSSWRFPG